MGAGSWGLAVAALASQSADVRLVCRTPEQAQALAPERSDRRYLTQMRLPEAVTITHLGAEDALAGCHLVALAVPSRSRQAVAEWLVPRLEPGVGICSLTKGLDPATGRRLGEVWAETLGAGHPICVLTGPNHAEEVAAGQPTAAVVAGDLTLGERVQALLGGPRFRVYLNDDLIGVELAAAAKNVVALAAGMSDGLGYGDNAKASLVTRGLAEMTRLGVAYGGRDATFRGLAGMGDLVATCTSRHSRNRRAGEMIAQGTPAADVEAALGQVVEGLATVENLLALAERAGVELPISTEVSRAAFTGRPASECVAALMARAPAAED